MHHVASSNIRWPFQPRVFLHQLPPEPEGSHESLQVERDFQPLPLFPEYPQFFWHLPIHFFQKQLTDLNTQRVAYDCPRTALKDSIFHEIFVSPNWSQDFFKIPLTAPLFKGLSATRTPIRGTPLHISVNSRLSSRWITSYVASSSIEKSCRKKH